MKLVNLCILIAITVQSPCLADVTKLTVEHRRVLENAASFRAVSATTNLPPTVVALCADEKGRLAEPGQKWEATDVITDASLPRKRLIWAAASGEFYVVHYERGGRGHSFHVLLAQKLKGEPKARALWRGVGGPLKEHAAFLEALRKGTLDDRREYSH